MKHRILTSSVVAFGLIFSSPAAAGMAVFDASNLAEAQKQFTEMKKQIETLKEQLDVLNEARDIANDTFDAIGEVGNISLPLINPQKLSSQIANDVGCLLPDFDKLMPGLNTDDLDWSSICEVSHGYRKRLVISREDYNKLTVDEKVEKVQDIRTEQEKVLVDSSTKGLAQADIAQNTAKDTLKASQEYRQAAQNAEDVNQRLSLMNEQLTAILISNAQTNQLLAQILKVQSSVSLRQSGVHSDLAVTESDQGDAQ